jgi:hypothetical protein
MRTGHERFVGDGDGLDIDAAPEEDIPGGDGFHVFEAVRKEKIYAVHG